MANPVHVSASQRLLPLTHDFLHVPRVRRGGLDFDAIRGQPGFKALVGS